MSTNWFKRLCDSGFKFPDSYIVFDTETTGLNVKYDYVVQFGHLFVEDRKPREPVATILDWTRCPQVSHGDVRQRLYETEDDFRKQGQVYCFSYERIAKEGVDPIAVLDIYLDLFRQHQDAGGYFLTHNGIRFDTQIVQHQFRRFLSEDFTFDPCKVVDTGLFEKARQLDMMLRDDEDLASFYHRINKTFARGVTWSLDKHCIPNYKLDSKYRLDMQKAHTAGFDCYVTHLLMEEFRQQSENTR